MKNEYFNDEELKEVEATVEDVRKELRKHDINVRRAM